MNRKFLVFSFLLIVVTLSACQTNELKRYEQLKVGMDKGEVLELMGSPRYTDRRQGEDRWRYMFYQNQELQQKEVRFLNGKSTYVGDCAKPGVSAEDQDLQNEKHNNELEAQRLQQRQNNQSQIIKFFEEPPGSQQNSYVPRFSPVQ